MKTYTLDADQQVRLEKAFLLMPPQDGAQEKIEKGTEKISQTAKYLMTLTMKCPEQAEMLKKLQEVNQWFRDAIIKNEGT